MSTGLGEPVPGVGKIAVLRANALGDFLFALPALEALKARYPDAELVYIGDTWHARELAGRPGPIDRFLTAPAGPGIRPAAQDEPPAEEFYAKARAERFDLALQMHGGGGNSNPIVTGLGARVTAGLRAPDAPRLDREVPYVYFQPEVFRYLEVAALVGAAPVTYRPRFLTTEADVAEAQAVAGAPELPRVALHPGANDARRRWDPRRFAAIADALAESGAEIVVTGGPHERELAEQVVSHARLPVRSLAGALSLGGLAGLYTGCSLVVGNDTGPLHLATAVGTPTVGLYWPANLINCAPAHRAAHRPVVSWTLRCPVCGADCAPNLHQARASAGCDHRVSFIDDIPVEEVLDAALDLLKPATTPDV